MHPKGPLWSTGLKLREARCLGQTLEWVPVTVPQSLVLVLLVIAERPFGINAHQKQQVSQQEQQEQLQRIALIGSMRANLGLIGT